MCDAQKQEIGKRLWQERARLDLTQAEMATRGGVGFSTYTAYEKGRSVPDAIALQSWSEHGVDVLFVVTGTHSTGSTMPPDELTLLDYWRDSPEELREAWLGFYRAYGSCTRG